MKIAVAGYGMEGRSNYKYWTNLGYEVDILDENNDFSDIPDGATAILGKNAYLGLSEYDFVVRTAGLNPNKLLSAKRIWSATNEFFEKCKAPIIGVTGSKGKGTTASLIACILKASGRKVHLVGNIGVPSLDVLDSIEEGDIVVYELSSFQLWDLERSPRVAVILHIEPDHLDVHADFDEYIDAKSNIARYQSGDDITIYHPSNTFSARIANSRQANNSQAIRYGLKNQDISLLYSYYEDGCFRFGSGDLKNQVICSVDALRLPGAHNIDNANAAIAATLQFDVDSNAIEKGLSDFTGLRHRLKLVGQYKGVKYYDDSIATTPGSAIAAVKSFREPKILILGGSSKGADFSELAKVISHSEIRLIILVGLEADRIETALVKQAVNVELIKKFPINSTMSDFVDVASQLAKPGDVVLLSPACASFGQFKNYQDRGNQFIAAVSNLSTSGVI